MCLRKNGKSPIASLTASGSKTLSDLANSEAGPLSPIATAGMPALLPQPAVKFP